MRLTNYPSLLLAALFVFGSLPSASQAPAEAIGRFPDFLEILYLTDKEAGATDPQAIEQYSNRLVEWLVPSGIDKAYAASLSDRLAKAELAARAGRQRLVPEADVARAFNRLMKKIEAPASFQTSEAAVHSFRASDASIRALPSIVSVDRNGIECNPGEAVFLVDMLLMYDGKLPESLLDQIAARKQAYLQSAPARRENFTSLISLYTDAKGRLLLYSQHHGHSTIEFFNNTAQALNF